MPLSPDIQKTLKVYCRQCGKVQVIASGLGALEIPRMKQFEILLKVGWDVAPKLLCRDCACPMTGIEIAEWRKIKVYADAQKFVIKMKAKYGDRVKKFFTTQ